MPVAGVWVVAMFCVLCAWAANVFQQTLIGWVEGIPVIGGAIAKTISFDARIIDWLLQQVNPHSQAMQEITVNHATEQGLSAAGHTAAAGAIGRMQYHLIPGQINAAVGPVQQRLQDLTGGVNGFISGVNGFITWQHQQDDALHHQADTVLPQQLAATQQDLQQRISTVASNAASALQSSVAQVERDIGTAAAAAQAGAVKQVQPQIGQVQTDLGALAHQVTGVIAPTLATTVTAVGTLTATLTRVEECTAGICSTGSGPVLGDLGKLLQGIEAVVTDVAIFALMTEAITNARGLAGEVISVFGPVVDDTEALIRSHVKIPAA